MLVCPWLCSSGLGGSWHTSFVPRKCLASPSMILVFARDRSRRLLPSCWCTTCSEFKFPRSCVSRLLWMSSRARFVYKNKNGTLVSIKSTSHVFSMEKCNIKLWLWTLEEHVTLFSLHSHNHGHRIVFAHNETTQHDTRIFNSQRLIQDCFAYSNENTHTHTTLLTVFIVIKVNIKSINWKIKLKLN